MDFQGFYINLDRSPDRRAEVESQLARLNLGASYVRFAAVDGANPGRAIPAHKLSTGQLGCFLSHLELMEKNAGAGKHLHIVEDDILFSDKTPTVINHVLNEAIAAQDIVFTTTHVPVFNDAYKRYKELYDRLMERDANGNLVRLGLQVVDLAGAGLAGTSSMIVNKNSIAKLRDLYAAEIARGPRLPIDLFIRTKLQEGTLKVGCVFPFATSIRLDCTFATTITGDYDQISKLAGAIAQHSFFVDCDFRECEAWLKKLPLVKEGDTHRQLLQRILGFTLTPEYRSF